MSFTSSNKTKSGRIKSGSFLFFELPVVQEKKKKKCCKKYKKNKMCKKCPKKGL
jgi:hypothetical protein